MDLREIIVAGMKHKYNSKDFAAVDKHEMVVPGKKQVLQ
jgi:hypothetical protein